jgi:hypothetical protein
MTHTVIQSSTGCTGFVVRCERRIRSAMREPLSKTGDGLAPYPGPMNPRARRLIVSAVLGGLVLIVVITAAWNWLR